MVVFLVLFVLSKDRFGSRRSRFSLLRTKYVFFLLFFFFFFFFVGLSFLFLFFFSFFFFFFFFGVILLE
jgi:hypothetical protein